MPALKTLQHLLPATCCTLLLSGCQTMQDNPALASIGTALGGYAVCRLADGSDGACIAAGVAAGVVTYAYLQSQMEEIQQIENVEAEPCAASAKGREAYCVTMNAKAIEFGSGSSEINPASMQTLNQVADVVSQSPDTLVYIEGHTDTDGSTTFNQQLSEQRAIRVQRVFQNRGVGSDRMQVLGFGESHPLVDDIAYPSEKYRNRRVEIRVEGSAS